MTTTKTAGLLALCAAAWLSACGNTQSAGGCTIATGADGTRTVTCADGTSAALPGSQLSCSVLEKGDGTRVIRCADGTEITVRDGTDGAPGAPGEPGPTGPPGKDGTNGVDGVNGQPGEDGADGASGHDGADGQDGASALVFLAPEAAGTHCPAGGIAVYAGMDTNRDGVLDLATEATQTLYVCNGSNGADGSDGGAGTNGLTALLRLDVEPPGANCAVGGTAVHAGLDLDADGVLDDPEITQTRYVCSPSPYALALEFSGATKLGATRRSLLQLNARLLGLWDPKTPLAWRLTLTDADGAPVSGARFFSAAAGEEAASHGTWTSLSTTNAQGQLSFGRGPSFTSTEAGLQELEGETTRWSVQLDGAGSYRLRVQLLNGATGAEVGVRELPLSVVTVTTALSVTGLSGLVANDRALLSFNARLAPSVDAATPLRWRFTLTGADGAPQAGVPGYCDETDPDPREHREWAQCWVTDAQGQALYGPAAGFTPEERALQELAGGDFFFSAALPAGSYRLEAALVHAVDGSVVASTVRDFSVVHLTTQVRFSGFSALSAALRNAVEINVRLATTYDAQAPLRWRFTVTKDFVPVAGFRAYYDSTLPDSREHASWTEFWETDATGRAPLWPSADFTPATSGLQTPAGATLLFSLQPPQGSYALLVELVNTVDGSVAVSATKEFAVGP